MQTLSLTVCSANAVPVWESCKMPLAGDAKTGEQHEGVMEDLWQFLGWTVLFGDVVDTYLCCRLLMLIALGTVSGFCCAVESGSMSECRFKKFICSPLEMEKDENHYHSQVAWWYEHRVWTKQLSPWQVFLAKIKKLIMVNSSLVVFGEGNGELQQSLFLSSSSEWWRLLNLSLFLGYTSYPTGISHDEVIQDTAG